MKRLPFLLALLAALVAPASAGVNLKNGNFYISYSDYSEPNGIEITRTYNSRGGVATIFGVGWAYNFGHRLQLMPDGTLELLAHGAGGTRIYRPAPPRKPGALAWRSDESEIAEFDGAAYRVGLYGETFVFDDSGRLLEVLKGGARQFKLDYENGLAVRLTTPRNVIQLDYATSGLLLGFTVGDKRASYEYLANDSLAASRDAAGNRYRFEYGRDGDLAAIFYDDGTATRIAYDGDGKVASIVDRSGEKTRYLYGLVTPAWYWTIVLKRWDSGGEQTLLYEYLIHDNRLATARIRTWTMPEGYRGGRPTGELAFSEETFNESGQRTGKSTGTMVLPAEIVVPPLGEAP